MFNNIPIILNNMCFKKLIVIDFVRNSLITTFLMAKLHKKE